MNVKYHGSHLAILLLLQDVGIVRSVLVFLVILSSGACAGVQTYEVACQLLCISQVYFSDSLGFCVSSWPWAKCYLTGFRTYSNVTALEAWVVSRALSTEAIKKQLQLRLIHHDNGELHLMHRCDIHI